MRSKVIVWGFVVVAVALLFTGAQAQRIALSPTAAPAKPQQVEVTNFPAVQEVGGTVNVGNLPLDGDGNVRVAGGAAFKVVRLFDRTTFPPAGVFQHVGPFDVAGWRRATVFVNHPDGPQVPDNNYAQVEYGIDGHFIRTADLALNDERSMSTTDVVMPQMRLAILATTDQTIEAWLYLSN